MRVQVICSRDVKVSGLLGSAATMDGKSSAVADLQVGLGGTTKWRLASLVRQVLALSPRSCLANVGMHECSTEG